MSNIVITSQNISRFAKRLQKAIFEETGHKIPLNQASLLLSKTFGKNSIYELQKSLEDASKNPVEVTSLEQIFDLETENFKNKFENILEYISQEKDSKIRDLFFVIRKNQLFMSISSTDGYREFHSFQPGQMKSISPEHFSLVDYQKLNEFIAYVFDENIRFVAHKYVYFQISQGNGQFWPSYKHLRIDYSSVCEDIFLIVPESSNVEINGSYLQNSDKTIYIDPPYLESYLKKGCYFITDPKPFFSHKMPNCYLYGCFRQIFNGPRNEQHVISNYYVAQREGGFIYGQHNSEPAKNLENIQQLEKINQQLFNTLKSLK